MNQTPGQQRAATNLALSVCLILGSLIGLALFLWGGDSVPLTYLSLTMVLIFIIYFSVRSLIRKTWESTLLQAIFLTSNWGIFFGNQLVWSGQVTVRWYMFRIMGGVTGLLLLFALMFAGKKKTTAKYKMSALDKVIGLYAAGMLWQLVMGLIRNNPLSLIVGDCYLWIRGPLTYATLRQFGVRNHVTDLWNNLAVILFFGSVYGMTLQWVEYVTRGYIPTAGGTYLMFPAAYYFTTIALKIPGMGGKVAFFLSLIVMLVSLKRGPMISLGLGIIITSALMPNIQKFRVIIGLILVVGMLTYLSTLSSDAGILDFSSIIEKRYQTMEQGARGNPVEIRFQEVRRVMDTLESSDSFINYFSGLGAGAEVYDPRILVGSEGIADTTSGYVHSIHVTPASIYFRGGILCLIVAAMAFGGSLFMLFRTTRRIHEVPKARRRELIAAQVWMLGACIDSLKAYGLVPQTLVWLSMATISNHSDQEMANTQNSDPTPDDQRGEDGE